MSVRSHHQAGVEAHKRNDHLAALREFLCLSEQKIDLAQSWKITGRVNRLALDDVDLNASKDVVVLSSEGKLQVFLLGAQKDHPPLIFNGAEHTCFCTLPPESGRPQVLVASKTSGNDKLAVYRVLKQGNRNTPQLSRELNPGVQGQVLDMVSRRGKVYVTTSAQRIYQYNGTNFKFEHEFLVGKTIRCLVSGGPESGGPQFLVGISVEGGLVIFENGLGGLGEMKIVEQQTQFISVYLADTNNDGDEDIIACSHGGKVVVFDRESLFIRHEYSLADELYDVCCEDIDFDGTREILVGAKGNRLYALGLDANRELGIKHIFPMEHRVLRLWAGSIDSGGYDKRLVVALGDGRVQAFRVFPPQEISRNIRESFRALKSVHTNWSSVLLSDHEAEVVRFGLDQIAQTMSCQEIVQFLERPHSYETSMAVLPKLKVFVNKCPADLDVTKSISEFLNQTFRQRSDLLTCQRICTILDDITGEPSGSTREIHDLSKQFHDALAQRQTIREQRVSAIYDLIGDGRLNEAQRELKALALLGIDLLKARKTRDGIKKISYSDEVGRIVLTTNTDTLRFLDIDWREQSHDLSFSASKIHYSRLSGVLYSHMVCHDKTVDFYDEHFTSQLRRSYSDLIRSAQVIEDGRFLYWVIGLDNGQVILDDRKGRSHVFQAPTPPLRVVQRKRENTVDVYFITLDCQIFVWRDVLGLMKGARGASRQPTQVHALTPCVNVLDFVLVERVTDEVQFLLLAPQSVYRILLTSRQSYEKEISIGRHLTCVTPFYETSNYRYEMLLGTQNRSLLFVDRDGRIQQETSLADIPTSLYPNRDIKGSAQFLVGFAQGDIHLYQCVGPLELESLRRQCDRGMEFSNLWVGFSYEEKLVLIAIASEKRLNARGIQNHFDSRVALLITGDALFQARQSLEERKVIQAHVAEGDVSYSLIDDDFGEWIAIQTDQSAVVRDHHDAAIDNLALSDIWRVDQSSRGVDQKDWFSEILRVTSQKWDTAVRLSLLLRDREQNLAGEAQNADEKWLALLCEHVQVFLKESPLVSPPNMSIFIMKIPQVKFDSFDRILVVVPNGQEPEGLRASTERLVNEMNIRIVLVIARSMKSFFKDILRGSAFSFAVLDDDDLKHILLASSPREEFMKRFVDQIDVTAFSPFRIAGPVRKMFYGRETERQHIKTSLQRPGAKCYAVIGPRRIGKTSLMLRAYDDIKEERRYEAVFVDISPYQGDITKLYAELLNRLGVLEDCRDGGEFTNLVNEFCQRRKCRLVLLLDEVDRYLTIDAERGYPFLNTLRALITSADVKVLIAGYDVLYFQMHDIASPLFNMLDPLELSSLDKGDSRALIVESLSGIFSIGGLGIDSILDRTGCYPNFVQFCCHQLVENAAREGRRFIDSDDVDKAINGQELYEHMVKVYLDNLTDQALAALFLLLTHYNPQLAKFVTRPTEHEQATKSGYAGSRHKYEIGDSFTPYDLHRLLELHDVKLSPKELGKLMNRLVLASVVRPKAQSKAYEFTLPDLPIILRQHLEIEETAVNYLERIKEVFSR